MQSITYTYKRTRKVLISGPHIGIKFEFGIALIFNKKLNIKKKD